jgi:hypothetical protein
VISHPDLLESATAARSVALPEPRIGVDYAEFLLEVLHDAQRWGPNHAALLRQMELQTERLLLGPARAFEATASIESMTQATKRCRDLLRPIWERGAIGYEITHWPRGPGSAAAMELIYRNEYPTSDLSAHYTEWFLLTRDLAHAVRSRKDLLLQHLVGEINARRGAVRILASSSWKPSSATRRKACRGSGVISLRCRSGASPPPAAIRLRGTEFQILANAAYKATRGFCLSSRIEGSSTTASSVSAT